MVIIASSPRELTARRYPSNATTTLRVRSRVSSIAHLIGAALPVFSLDHGVESYPNRHMAVAYELPALSKEAVANTASLLRIVILVFISGAAIASRLFAVINFESIIHEL